MKLTLLYHRQMLNTLLQNMKHPAPVVGAFVFVQDCRQRLRKFLGYFLVSVKTDCRQRLTKFLKILSCNREKNILRMFLLSLWIDIS